MMAKPIYLGDVLNHPYRNRYRDRYRFFYTYNSIPIFTACPR